MKTIVCYGDSNTWGFNPDTQERYAFTQRWTGVLAEELGAEYRVIEEGLNGRTTIWDDPIFEGCNGKTYLVPCLRSHQPIDLVTIMLGTNDLKVRFSITSYDIAAGVGALVDLALRSGTGPHGAAPQVLLMAPAPIRELQDFAEVLAGGEEKSLKFAEYYERIAKKYRVGFLDTGKIVVSSDIDGVHLEADQHRNLALAVAGCVREFFK